MSVPVSIERLREAMVDFHAAPYFLTVSADGRPHAVAVEVTWIDDLLELAAGRTSCANAGDRPLVSLVWPPDVVGGYSLIVDAVAHVLTEATDGPGVSLAPTKAVLHRAPASDGQRRRPPTPAPRTASRSRAGNPLAGPLGAHPPDRPGRRKHPRPLPSVDVRSAARQGRPHVLPVPSRHAGPPFPRRFLGWRFAGDSPAYALADKGFGGWGGSGELAAGTGTL